MESWNVPHGGDCPRRKTEMIGYLGVDEKSFRKGHKYLTLVNDLARGRVLYVAKDRASSL